MNTVNLTKDLKNHKAIVILDGKEPPKDYISVAGGFVSGHDVEVAIPKELMSNRKLFNTLANQAKECLMKSMLFGLRGI